MVIDGGTSSVAVRGVSQVLGEPWSRLDRPAPDRLVADPDPALRVHLFYFPQARGEAEIEPHRMADDVSWKAVTLE
jgi:hypothetical protein